MTAKETASKKPTAWNFNKEILFGEIGAFIFANITTVTVSHFTKNTTLISGTAVAGTIVGGILFWLCMRVYDRIKSKSYEKKTIASDFAYYSVASFVIGIGIYDPTLYFISNFLLKKYSIVELSVITGQVIAFCLFLTFMNLYRLLLMKFKWKDL